MPMIPEMNHDEAYQQWLIHSKTLIKECQKYDEWRRRTMHAVLTDLAPRIAILGRTFYSGCGFHYHKESQLGKAISALSICYQWCANHCEKIPNERLTMILNQVMVGALFREVKQAEESAKELAQKT